MAHSENDQNLKSNLDPDPPTEAVPSSPPPTYSESVVLAPPSFSAIEITELPIYRQNPRKIESDDDDDFENPGRSCIPLTVGILDLILHFSYVVLYVLAIHRRVTPASTIGAVLDIVFAVFGILFAWRLLMSGRKFQENIIRHQCATGWFGYSVFLLIMDAINVGITVHSINVLDALLDDGLSASMKAAFLSVVVIPLAIRLLFVALVGVHISRVR